MQKPITNIDIGIFAHNEAQCISNILQDIIRQDILLDPNFSVRVLVLANGCTDNTAHIAKTELEGSSTFDVVELTSGGKSRTWNSFVHNLSRPEADFLCFCDADLGLPEPGTISRLAELLLDQKHLSATRSRPVKDIVYYNRAKGAVENLIASSGLSLDDWKRSISGLYLVRTSAARSFHLPIGLPVDDGFVRAMLLTRVFTVPEDETLIDARDDAFHVYASEVKISALIRHQTRIVIGSAINTVLFGVLTAPGAPPADIVLAEAAKDDGWVTRVLQRELPSWRFGWVPLHFLTKRLSNFRRSGGYSARSLGLLIIGVGFDTVVYLIAQAKMARGSGAGYW